MQLRVMPIFNLSSIEVCFDAINNVADGTVRIPLYEEDTLSISNADFRLYEFLKNNMQLQKLQTLSPTPFAHLVLRSRP
jgi:hypothetical protein